MNKNFADREATAGAVLSSLGLIFFFSLPSQILGLILGIKGLKANVNKSFAKAAIILSLFGMLLFLIFIIFMVNYYYY